MGYFSEMDFAQREEKKWGRPTKAQQRQAEWRTTVWETGATPDHQIVLPGVFFPAEGRWVAA